MQISLDAVYVPSEYVMAKEIRGDFIIIPTTAGIADLVDNIFTLNETGRAIWDKLDGERTLKDIIDCLGLEFEASTGEIEGDVFRLTEELIKRRILVKI